jgi:hypothetical protein
MTDQLETDPKTRGAPFKVEIGSIDNTALKVTAQFNPKELQIDKNVPWSKKEKNYSNQVQLEFTGVEARTMTLELLFDGFEDETSVQDSLERLTEMASPIADPGSKKTAEERKRPHHVIVTWGATKSEKPSRLLPFKGVIESLQTKMQVFAADGTVLRATCNVKVKEADAVSLAKKK